MKVEINLDEVFRGEDGEPGETLQESITRQVIDRLSADNRQRFFQRFDEALTKVMQAQIAEVMKTRMPDMIDDIMNATYTPVSSYGQRGEQTTFRAEIIKSVAANLVYKPSTYSSDENAFTQAVKSIVKAQTDAITKSLKGQIDGEFAKNAMTYAVKTLSERLGLTKSA